MVVEIAWSSSRKENWGHNLIIVIGSSIHGPITVCIHFAVSIAHVALSECEQDLVLMRSSPKNSVKLYFYDYGNYWYLLLLMHMYGAVHNNAC